MNNEIMNEVDWKKDGEVGCLMGLAKVAAGTVALIGVLILAYTFLFSSVL